MENAIVIFILISVIGIAITYIVRAKRSGVKCIGCPAAGKCSRCHNSSKEWGITELEN